MARRVPFACGLLLAACGCVTDQGALALVQPGPPGQHTAFSPPSLYRLPHAPATEAESVRVDAVGQKLLAANDKANLHPHFACVGVKEPEVFHQGEAMVYVTEGLTRQCETEGQLAAVLSVELARMAAERERLASPAARQLGSRPPID